VVILAIDHGINKDAQNAEEKNTINMFDIIGFLAVFDRLSNISVSEHNSRCG